MLITLIILFILFTGFYAGYRRGLVLQLVYFVGYTASFWVARQLYRPVGEKISMFIPYPAPTLSTQLTLFDMSLLFDLDKAFYATLGFIIVLFAGYLVTRLIGMLCYSLTFIPFIGKANKLLGAFLNGLVTYIGVVIVLTLMSMVPLPIFQNMFLPGSFAHQLVTNTPILSNVLYDWFIQKIIL